jgi:hypothetical protein
MTPAILVEPDLLSNLIQLLSKFGAGRCPIVSTAANIRRE